MTIWKISFHTALHNNAVQPDQKELDARLHRGISDNLIINPHTTIMSQDPVFADEEGGPSSNVAVGIPEAGYADEEPTVDIGGNDEADPLQGYVADEDVVEAINVEVVMTEEEEALIARQKQRRTILAVFGCMVLVAVIVIPTSIARSDSSSSNTRSPTFAPTESPSASPSAAPTIDDLPPLIECLTSNSVTPKEVFEDRSSGQYLAINWMASEDQYWRNEGLECPEKRFLERYALATIYFAMNGENWGFCGRSDPSCTGSSVAGTIGQFGWLSNNDHCDWNRIQCEGEDVTGIVLGAQPIADRDITVLEGLLPPELGILTNMVQLMLKGSRVQEIPTFLNRLSKLETFNIEINGARGKFFDFDSTDFPHLKRLVLSLNELTGEIPDSHGSFAELTEYRAGSNKLTGRIPESLTELSNLGYLDLSANDFTGLIPPGIFDLAELRVLALHTNEGLSGSLPETMDRLRELVFLRMNYTNINGPIPTSLYSLPDIQEINLRACGLTGNLDVSVQNVTYLNKFDVGLNPNLGGAIPDFSKVEYLGKSSYS